MKSKKISDICDVIGGFAFQSSSMKSDNGKYQVVKMSNLYKGTLDLDRNPSYLDEIEFRHKQYLLKDGDVLMTLTGTIGKRDYGYSVQIEKQKNLVLNQRVCLLRPKIGKVNGYYLLQLLRSKEFLDQFFESSIGGTGNQSNVSITILKDMIIDLPEIEGQTAIASLLSTWDFAIEKTERLIAAKERCNDSLVQRLVSSHSARQHWETVELGSVIAERNERSRSHGEFPVLTSSRRGLFLQSDYFTKHVTSEDTTGYKIMRRGEFTFRSMSDDGRFVFNRLDALDNGIISPAYGVFYVTCVDSDFLMHLLNSSYFGQLLTREAQGGTRKALRFSTLSSIEIDLPQHEEQQRIAAVLNTARQEIDLLKKQAEAYRRQKRGLMQKLLTGEWRVGGVPSMAGIAT